MQPAYEVRLAGARRSYDWHKQPRETWRNEVFECDIDSETGGIRSFRDMRTRQTRFGQQLAYNPGSKMVARDISITNNGTALGEITSSERFASVGTASWSATVAPFRRSTVRNWNRTRNVPATP